MLTQRLAQFVTDTRTEEIPTEVLDGARAAIIDTIGCAIAGSIEETAEIAAAWVRHTDARGQSTVWGRELRSSPAEAAFANGVASHALDFDDSLPSLRGHPSATMVPAALAVAEVTGASGAAVLAAYALGLEVAGKLGRALGVPHYIHGWHSTATVGAFSATAAAARLWKLDAAQLQAAWGLAASQTAGLVKNFGTMTKPFHAGHAARTGVVSAWMAHQGFTANTAIFDDGGFFHTYGRGGGEPLDSLLDLLGKPWEMVKPGIYVKRWPCCYCNHRPVGGILELIEKHDIRADEVESVEIGFVRGSDEALGGPNPQTGLEGKFSMEYVAAATLLDRKLTLETFTDPMVQRPEARALTAKVRRYRVDDEKLYSSKFGYTDVAIRTKRGQFTVRAERVSGSPEWPMTSAERAEKFTDCASRVLGNHGAGDLHDKLSQLGSASNIAAAVEATVPRASAQRGRAGAAATVE
jgi:2-methylcitrate dehydratase PrpD